jgi:hypothetical protein
MFAVDLASWAPEYQSRGWVHVRSGATAEFCDYVRSYIREEAGNDLHGKGIGGAKDQLLLDLPPELDLETEVLEPIAGLAGLDPRYMTISERHIKVYTADAAPFPRPHKDRFASQVNVGISIDIPDGSHVVIFPETDVAPNPLLRAGLADSLPPDRLPDVVLAGDPGVEIHDRPGDLLAFPGASYWHLRRHSALAVIVYLKLNNFGSDPLGEDPRTAQRRDMTAYLLSADDRFAGAVPRLGAKFESVTREYARDFSTEWLNVNVWDRPPRMITEMELDAIRSVDGVSTVTALASKLASRAGARGLVIAAFARLCELGVIDLFEAL